MPLSDRTPEERAAAAERGRAERAAQGVPEKLTDPVLADRIARLLAPPAAPVSRVEETSETDEDVEAWARRTGRLR